MRHMTRRGIQTALVTGGLLMLGTGIASATENVDPDRPASPIDGSITVPVDIGDNAVGAPDGEQYDAPEHQGVYSSREVTDPIKEEFEANLPEQDPFRGNRINADIVVPVQIANNAVGLLGDAEVSGNDHEQTYDGSSDIETDGAGGSLAGNVVDADWAAPVQISNNALGLGGDATSTGNSASQSTTTGGDDTTDGTGGVLAGNVAAVQGATPVQINNNAGAVGGTAESSGNEAESEAASGGSIVTNGNEGVLAGNALGAPVAFPVELVGGAYSGVGIAESSGNSNTATATGGGTRKGINDINTYIRTEGEEGVASGNVAQTPVAGDAAVHNVAATAVGIATVGGGSDARADGANTNETNSKAGAFSSSDGEGSVLGGNLVDGQVAAPVEVYCVSGSLVGISSATCENDTSADAGSGTFTDGEDATFGGNSVNVPVATAIESFGVAGTAGGSSEANATEDKTVDAGGYNGTRGNDSTGSGNVVQTPVAAPIESFAIGAAAAGESSGTATETKDVNAGGDGNTVDDDGAGSSNVIATPIAVPVQVFGIGGAGVGSATGDGTSDTTTNAGGDYTGTGTGAALSGNVVQVASSSPAQLFGIGGAAGGNATGLGDNTSDSNAGGNTHSDGSDGEGSGNVVAVANSLPAQVHSLGGSAVGDGSGSGSNVTDSTAGGETGTGGSGGSLAGNVVSAPVAGAVSLFGDAATALGHAAGDGSNDVVTGAGGDTETSGDDGSLAGNVITAQALPVAQVFGDAVSVGGEATGTGSNTTDAVSGGNSGTSGADGSLSGNIIAVPAAVVAQVFADALTVGGDATGNGDNTTTGVAGGLSDTSGDNASGSGFAGQVPVGAVVQAFGLEGPIFGQALAQPTNVTAVTVGGEAAQLNVPITGSELPADGLPSLDALPSASDVQSAPLEPLRSERPDVSPALMPSPISTPAPATTLPAPAMPMDLPEVPGLDSLGDLEGLPQGLDELPIFAITLPAPAMPEVAQTLPAPAMPEVAQTLPAPAVPGNATTLPAPAMPEVAQTLPAPAVPGMAHIQPASSVQQTGLRGMWAKLAGFLTNRPMHIEG